MPLILHQDLNVPVAFKGRPYGTGDDQGKNNVSYFAPNQSTSYQLQSNISLGNDSAAIVKDVLSLGGKTVADHEFSESHMRAANGVKFTDTP